MSEEQHRKTAGLETVNSFRQAGETPVSVARPQTGGGGGVMTSLSQAVKKED